MLAAAVCARQVRAELSLHSWGRLLQPYDQHRRESGPAPGIRRIDMGHRSPQNRVGVALLRRAVLVSLYHLSLGCNATAVGHGRPREVPDNHTELLPRVARHRGALYGRLCPLFTSVLCVRILWSIWNGKIGHAPFLSLVRLPLAGCVRHHRADHLRQCYLLAEGDRQVRLTFPTLNVAGVTRDHTHAAPQCA